MYLRHTRTFVPTSYGSKNLYLTAYRLHRHPHIIKEYTYRLCKVSESTAAPVSQMFVSMPSSAFHQWALATPHGRHQHVVINSTGNTLRRELKAAHLCLRCLCPVLTFPIGYVRASLGPRSIVSGEQCFFASNSLPLPHRPS